MSDDFDETSALGLAGLVCEASSGAAARDEATLLFNRASQSLRMQLLRTLAAQQHRNNMGLDPEAIGAILRQAYTTEPYIDGQRRGNYLTALLRHSDQPLDRTAIENLMRTYGFYMMDEGERLQLEALPFPMSVYRGGVASLVELAAGLSWTTEPTVAHFFAETWPKRWGATGHGQIICRTVERIDVAAMFLDREESELIVWPSSKHKARIYPSPNEAASPHL